MDEYIYFVEVERIYRDDGDAYVRGPVLKTEPVKKRAQRTVETVAGPHWTRRRNIADCDFTPADAWRRFIGQEKQHIEHAQRELDRHRALYLAATTAVTALVLDAPVVTSPPVFVGDPVLTLEVER